MHRSFAAWAVGGLLRESQQFSPIRSQTLMPSFVFLCSRQCSTEPPSQPRRPATRRGIFFREFRFPLLRFLRSRFSATVMSLAFYTDIESSRVEQAAAAAAAAAGSSSSRQQQQQQAAAADGSSRGSGRQQAAAGSRSNRKFETFESANF